MSELAVVALGDVHAEALAALTPHFSRIEQLVLDIPPRDPLSRHRAEFNRAIDAASPDWVLIVREREQITQRLAREVETAIREAKAWGFRITAVPHYAGKPLRIGSPGGEVRLFHKRHYLRFANRGEWDEIAVQGTVVRIAEPLPSVTFESAEAHREHLSKQAGRRSHVRRLLRFLRDVLGTRARDRNTLRYIWIESAYDQTEAAAALGKP